MAEPSIFWEDVAVGEPRTFGAYDVTREEVLAFARAFDPQPFHLDDEAAAASPVFGRLAASGLHTIAMATRLSLDNQAGRYANMGGTGMDKIRWHVPVYPGDRLSIRLTIVSKRRSRSRPEMGLLTQSYEVLNQHGAVVLTYELGGMMRLRDPGAPFAD